MGTRPRHAVESLPDARTVPSAEPVAGAGTGPSTEPDLLELRVHGVNNTPPHAVLDLPLDGVEQVAGDSLGSFWRPTARALSRLRPGDRGHVPAGVLREAYSWGGLARTSPGAGTGPVGLVAAATARVGWALLMPFGLVNVAFWSRRLDGPQGYLRGWQDGASAAAVRLFALVLTLLLIGTTSVVSLDLVATQCFAGSRRWCERLPAALDGLAGLSQGQRLAVASLVPLAVLALLAGLSTLSRTRYEQLAAMPSPRDQDVAAGTPVLATPGFWSNARLTSSVGRAHLAGALCFMVLGTAWHQVFGTGTACTDPSGVLGAGRAACWTQLRNLPPTALPFLVTLGLSALGLGGVVVVLASRTWGTAAMVGSAAATRVGHALGRFLGACVVLFLGHTLVLVLVHHETSPGLPLLGMVATPVVLTTVLLAVSVSARHWRRMTHRRHEAWGGRGPAVFLLLALGVALTLSTVVVVAVGDWLNGARSAGDLMRPSAGLPGTRPVPDRSGCHPVCPVPDPHLVVPSVYLWFGAATFLALFVVGAVAAVAALRTSRTLPAAGAVDPRARDWARRGGSVAALSERPGTLEAVRAARWRAGVAHRAEPITRVLAEATLVCAATAVVVTAAVAVRPGLGPPQVRGSGSDAVGRVYGWLVDAAAWGSGMTGVLVLTGIVGGALTGRARPLGLLWDLICFLPRTGHPFGPPCYAERVVPELVRRYDDWLEPTSATEGADPSGSPEARPGGAETLAGRGIVVSAHSLGAVLAVASLFAVWVEGGRRVLDRIALITYGVQLRAYFGRMFPELLGPTVLGTAPGLGARLTTPDPWVDAVAEDEAASRAAGEPVDRLPATAQPTVTGLLTTGSALRWLSLWRRTDYLGFPVDSFAAGPVDRPAEEVDTSGLLPEVATHGNYPRTGAYALALAELRRRF